MDSVPIDPVSHEPIQDPRRRIQVGPNVFDVETLFTMLVTTGDCRDPLTRDPLSDETIAQIFRVALEVDLEESRGITSLEQFRNVVEEARKSAQQGRDQEGTVMVVEGQMAHIVRNMLRGRVNRIHPINLSLNHVFLQTHYPDQVERVRQRLIQIIQSDEEATQGRREDVEQTVNHIFEQQNASASSFSAPSVSTAVTTSATIVIPASTSSSSLDHLTDFIMELLTSGNSLHGAGAGAGEAKSGSEASEEGEEEEDEDEEDETAMQDYGFPAREDEHIFSMLRWENGILQCITTGDNAMIERRVCDRLPRPFSALLLYHAIMHESPACFEALMSNPIVIPSRREDQSVLLAFAMEHGQKDIVRMLLDDSYEGYAIPAQIGEPFWSTLIENNWLDLLDSFVEDDPNGSTYSTFLPPVSIETLDLCVRKFGHIHGHVRTYASPRLLQAWQSLQT